MLSSEPKCATISGVTGAPASNIDRPPNERGDASANSSGGIVGSPAAFLAGLSPARRDGLFRPVPVFFFFVAIGFLLVF